MSSHERHDQEKERLREIAQRERANKANTNESVSLPLFDEPSKVKISNDNDRFQQKIRNVLGDYSVFKMLGPKVPIGALSTPVTPQPDASTSKGFSFKDPGRTLNGVFKQRHRPTPREEGLDSDLKHGDRKSAHRRRRSDGKSKRDHRVKVPDKLDHNDSVDSITSVGNDHESQRSDPSQINFPSRDTTTYENSKERKSAYVSPKDSKPGASHSQVLSPSSLTKFSSPKLQTDTVSSPTKLTVKCSTSPYSSQTKPSVQATSVKESPQFGNKSVPQRPAPKSMTGEASSPSFPGVTPLRETAVQPNRLLTKSNDAKQQRNKLPQLLMPRENNSLECEGLRDIFKEMKSIPVPVTEIYTPRKSEIKPCFPLPAKPEKPVPAISTSTELSGENEAKEESMDGVTSKRDIEPSGMSSGSDSSSEVSESSSETSDVDEDKESSKKVAEENPDVMPAQTETHSWGLQEFIQQLKKSSPETLLPKTSSEKENEIDKDNDKMLGDILFTSHPSRKGLDHSATLSFSTEHLASEGQEKGPGDSGCYFPSSHDSLGSPNSVASSCSSPSTKPPTTTVVKKGRGSKGSSKTSSKSPKGPVKSESSETSNVKNKGATKTKRTAKKTTKKRKPRSPETGTVRKRGEYKSKAVVSETDDFEIDVVSVTPDSKSNAPVSNSIPNEDKQKVQSQLFSSDGENSSPEKQSVCSVNSTTEYDGKKDDSSDEEVSTVHKRRSILPFIDSSVDLDEQDTHKFKPPSLLSPFSSPIKELCQSSISPISSPCDNVIMSKGKPRIIVEFKLSLLDDFPPCANSSATSIVLKVKSGHVTCNGNTTDDGVDVVTNSVDKDHQDGKTIVSNESANSVDNCMKDVEEMSGVNKYGNNTVTSSETISKRVCNSPVGAKEETCPEPTESQFPQVSASDKRNRSQKRKSDSHRQQTSTSKRHKSSSKLSRQSPVEDLHNGSHDVEGDSEVFARVRERRGSNSSSSSQRSTSSSRSQAIKPPEPTSPEKFTQVNNDISQQNSQNHLPFVSYNEANAKSESPRESQQHPNRGQDAEEKCEMDIRCESAESHLARAKELKHLADKDKPAKFSLYIKSVLSFVLCGYAMERDSLSEPQKIFTMYHDTLQLLKYLIRVRGSCIYPDVPINDKRLSVLLLRIQSLLCLKLFQLKRTEVMKFKKIIDADNTKAATAKSPHQTSLCNRSIGTPPPSSPTPSPAGSIGSVGSQGSCEISTGKLSNGSASGSINPVSSSGTVTVTHRIHSVTQQYTHLSGYLVTCHDLWLQADVVALEYKDFFDVLDNTCSPLSLHSSVLHLVQYVNEGLQLLKDT